MVDNQDDSIEIPMIENFLNPNATIILLLTEINDKLGKLLEYCQILDGVKDKKGLAGALVRHQLGVKKDG